jgi:hypothetical protein
MPTAASRIAKLAIAATLSLTAAGTWAQAVDNPVANGGVLVLSTASTTTDNRLDVAPSTFSFSGSTGGGVSPNGKFYADYLITVGDASAESVTTTLTNFGGVTNLSERIYTYGGSFLGDAAAPAGTLDAWSTNYTLPGATVSMVGQTALAAGQYVVELSGTSVGTFGGTLNLAAVPEADGIALALLGFGALGLIARRRGRNAV